MKKYLYLIFSMSLIINVNAYADEKPKNVTTDWRSYSEPFLEMGDRMNELMEISEDPHLQLELYKMIFMAVSAAYVNRTLSDNDQPEFWPFPSPAFNFGSPNPDDAYAMVNIEGDGVYKISGYRGSAHVVDFQIGGGTFMAEGTGNFGRVLANYDVDDLTLDEDDKSFEVILSGERPEGYEGDWLKLDPKGSYLVVRQVSYDWLNEVDGRFAIERLDRSAIQPPPSSDDIAKTLQEIMVWAENWTKFSIEWVKRYKERGLVNKVLVQDISDIAGATEQAYIDGLYEIEPDEALIYETEVPEACRFWNVTLNNMLWSQIDYMSSSRQSSLNGHSAKLDKDGKFRAVISIKDPGVPNWLDTMGHTKGTILGRWLECSSSPEPVITKVKVSEVRNYLPLDTPVVTAEERDQTARLRKKAAQLRRRW